MPSVLRPLRVCNIPCYVPYNVGFQLQEFLIERRAHARSILRHSGIQHTVSSVGIPPTLKKYVEIAQTDFLLLLQHTPVYTLGRRHDDAAISAALMSPDVDVVKTRRGGLLTYHGPGQLVGYPILDLGLMNVRIHACLLQLSTRCYVARLQDILRKSLSHDKIQLQTIDSPADDSKYTGVWSDPTHKIASIGVQVQHRVTSHGFALNVHENALDGFRKIVACGLPDVHLTCIDEQLLWHGRKSRITVAQVANIIANEFGTVLNRNIDLIGDVRFITNTKNDGTRVLKQIVLDGEYIPVK